MSKHITEFDLRSILDLLDANGYEDASNFLQLHFAEEEDDIVMSDTVSELTVDDMAKHLIKILVDNEIDDAEVLAEAIWDLFMSEPFPSLDLKTYFEELIFIHKEK